jgi:hypothetical protein
MRVCIPHMPQTPPMSISPGAHGPLPVQRPSSVHTPLLQICRCMPQCTQAIMRGGSPVVQSQLEGAVHAAQTPPLQRSTPVPHDELQARSDVEPTLAIESSQSIAAAMPS